MDSKLKSFIISLLRRQTMKWKPAQELEKEKKITYYITSKKGKKLKRVKWKCNICGKEINAKEKTRDHINPVVPVTGFDSWENLFTRIFCQKEGFQIICKNPCHAEKTKKENALRRENTKKKVD